MYVCSSLYWFQVKTSQCTQTPEAHLKLSWNKKRLQMFCLSLFTYLSKTPLEFLACHRFSNQTQHCVAPVWGKPSSQVVLISQKTGKKEGGNEKQVSYSNFYKLVCFSAGALILPQRQKATPVPQHSVREWVDNTPPVLHRTAAQESWIQMWHQLRECCVANLQ